MVQRAWDPSLWWFDRVILGGGVENFGKHSRVIVQIDLGVNCQEFLLHLQKFFYFLKIYRKLLVFF